MASRGERQSIPPVDRDPEESRILVLIGVVDTEVSGLSVEDVADRLSGALFRVVADDPGEPLARAALAASRGHGDPLH